MITGLGNSSPAYWKTRHNAGWWMVDEMSHVLGLTFRKMAFQQCLLAEKNWGSHRLFLAKLLSYMNLSGKVLIPLLKKLKLSKEELLVVVDQMDLDPGRVRLKHKGSHAGHNGLKSIESELGTKEYRRLYIGIGRPVEVPVIDYVLGVPPACEAYSIRCRLKELPPILLECFSQEWDVIASRINSQKEKS